MPFFTNGMKDARKHDRMQSLICRLSAEYLAREGGDKSLITVTRATLSEDRKYATIFFSAFPESYEGEAMSFVKRKAGDIREYLECHARMGHVPFLRFELDLGEKNRQKIETLSAERVLEK